MVAIPCAYTGSSVFIYPDYITKNTCLISCKIPTSDSLKPVYRSSKTNRELDEAVFFSITLQNKCFTTEYKKKQNKTVWIDANYTDLINCQTWWHCVVKSPKHFGRCFSLTEPANKPFQTGFVFSFLSINVFVLPAVHSSPNSNRWPRQEPVSHFGKKWIYLLQSSQFITAFRAYRHLFPTSARSQCHCWANQERADA